MMGKCNQCQNSGYIEFRDINNNDFNYILCYKCYKLYIKFDGDLYKFIKRNSNILFK